MSVPSGSVFFPTDMKPIIESVSRVHPEFDAVEVAHKFQSYGTLMPYISFRDFGGREFQPVIPGLVDLFNYTVEAIRAFESLRHTPGHFFHCGKLSEIWPCLSRSFDAPNVGNHRISCERIASRWPHRGWPHRRCLFVVVQQAEDVVFGEAVAALQKSSSTAKGGPVISPPNWLTSLMVASMVPPVASRSSTSTTRWLANPNQSFHRLNQFWSIVPKAVLKHNFNVFDVLPFSLKDRP